MTKTTITCDVCGKVLDHPAISAVELRGVVFTESGGGKCAVDFTIEPAAEHRVISDICAGCVWVALQKAIAERHPVEVITFQTQL